jgi:hypothetical protein
MRTAAGAAAALISLILSAAALAGCFGGGDGGGDGGPDPATLAPASSPVYVEAAVRPEGTVRSEAEAALGKILDGEDPGTRIGQELDRALREEGTGITYSRDIAPWLGERAGFFLPEVGSDGVLAIATTNPTRALASADRAAKRQDQSQKRRSYKGESFKVDSSFDAHGLIGDFLVVGSARDFRAAVDASQGQSLADDKAFTSAVADTRDTAVASAYVSPDRLLDAAAKDDPESASELEAAQSVLGAAARQPAVATLTPAEDRLTVELSTGAPAGASEPKQSQALLDLPSDAWAGLSLSGVAETVKRSLDSSGETSGSDELRQTFESATELDLEEDVLSWLGDAAAFAQGTSAEDFGAAAVILSNDAVLSQRALAKLTDLAVKGLIPGATRLNEQQPGTTTVPPATGGTTVPETTVPGTTGPVTPAGLGEEGFTVTPTGLLQPLEVVSRDDRIAVSYGAATEVALEPPDKTTLGDTAQFKRATKALGSGYVISGFAAVPPIVTLLQSVAGDEAALARARPFLQGLDFLVLGSARRGDREVRKLVIGLR